MSRKNKINVVRVGNKPMEENTNVEEVLTENEEFDSETELDNEEAKEEPATEEIPEPEKEEEPIPEVNVVEEVEKAPEVEAEKETTTKDDAIIPDVEESDDINADSEYDGHFIIVDRNTLSNPPRLMKRLLASGLHFEEVKEIVKIGPYPSINEAKKNRKIILGLGIPVKDVI